MEKEGPAEGLRRELAEEAGIVVGQLDRFKPIPPIAVSPNCNSHLICTYRIDLSQEECDSRVTHDKEICEVLCVSFDEVSRLIRSGEIYVVLPVAVISRFLITEQSFTR